MADFDIAAPNRVCTLSGRELQPGEKVFSVLRDLDGKLTRHDYAANAWPGPPADAIAWWMGKIPASGAAKKPIYNDDVLLDLFRHLAESVYPGKVNFRYVVALLLMRRKRLKFEDLRREAGQDVLVVRDVKTGERHQTVDPHLDETSIASVQEEVFTALGWSA